MRTLISIIFLCLQCSAVEILVRLQNSPAHPDPEEHRRGRTEAGMFIDAFPDGFWEVEQANPNSRIRLPKYGVVKIPGVSKAQVREYLEAEYDGNGDLYRARKWKLRIADVPAAIHNKMTSTGFITIKVGSYAGEYDYTWAQVRTFIRNLQTGLDETRDL